MAAWFSVYYYSLDKMLLNPKIFHELNTLTTDGFILGILSFQQIRFIRLLCKDFMVFFHNVGIEWMSYLNQNLPDFNLSNISFVSSVSVSLIDKHEELIITQTVYEFPDQDFCLFRNFPNDKLIYMELLNTDLNCTCTVFWLLKHAGVYSEILNSQKDQNYELCKYLGEDYHKECSNATMSLQKYCAPNISMEFKA
jgi:hypothetical protein